MRQSLKARLWLALVLLLLLGIAGCASQIPVAGTYESTTQPKMQAAEHWNVLAADVADVVEDSFLERDDLEGIPLFVPPPGERAFSQVFYRLLLSQLVSRGIQVSVQEEDTLTLDYRVLTVKHSERFQRPPMGTFTALPLGIIASRALNMDGLLNAALAAGVVADVAVGNWGMYSKNEVIISTSLTYNNRYVSHQSSIYYINDPDWAQYAEPIGAPENKSFSSVSISAVNE